MVHITGLPTDAFDEILWHLTGSEKNILRHVNKSLSELCAGHNFFNPYQYANDGNILVLEWAHNMGCKLSVKVGSHAAASGHLDLLKWMNRNKIPLNNCTPNAAAKGGHTKILEWLDTAGYPRSTKAHIFAAGYGHFETLKWMLDNGYEKYKSKCVAAASGEYIRNFIDVNMGAEGPSQFTIQCEYNVGHIKILELLLEHWSSQHSIKFAIDRGWFDMMKWIGEHTSPKKVRMCCNRAALNGQLDMLKWLYANDYPVGPWVCRCAARGGYIHILEWLKDNNLTWSNKIISTASGCGNLDVIEWAIDNGCDFDSTLSTDKAAGGGHLHVLKWLKIRGRLNTVRSASYHAALTGKLEVIEWLRDDGSVLDVQNLCNGAVMGRRLDMIEWLWKTFDIREVNINNLAENLIEIRITMYNSVANIGEALRVFDIRKSQLTNMLKFLIDKGYQWNSESCRIAAAIGNFWLLDWAYTEGYKVSKELYNHFADSRYLLASEWLRTTNITDKSSIWLILYIVITFNEQSGMAEVLESNTAPDICKECSMVENYLKDFTASHDSEHIVLYDKVEVWVINWMVNHEQ